MGRRYTTGERFMGNTNKREVHDLENEQTRCQIDEIVKAGHHTPFASKEAANRAGYDNCAYCIGNSSR